MYRIKQWLLMTILFSGFAHNVLSQMVSVPVVERSRRVDWSAAGILPVTRNPGLLPVTPAYADTVITLDPNYPGDDDLQVEAALNAARQHPGTTLIYFPQGTYYLSETISLLYDANPNANGSNIILQGAGADLTFLEFTVGRANRCFLIVGTPVGTEGSIDQNIDKQATTFIYSPSPGEPNLSRGDWIHICENGFDDAYYEDPPRKYVGQVTQIVEASGSVYTIEQEAAKSYITTNTLTVQRILPIVNVGIENLTIRRMDTQSAQGEENGTNIYFDYAINCWVKGVELDNTCKHHIEINHSAHIEVNGCYIHDARNTGDGSYGYGTVLQHSSTNCLIENNIFRKLRHAMAVCWGSNSNVFGYNYSREQDWNHSQYKGPDICIHGTYAFSNLFEGNAIDHIMLDATHGWNGPFNTFLRNRHNDWDGIVVFNADNTNLVANAAVTYVVTDMAPIVEWIIELFNDWDIIRESHDLLDVYKVHYAGFDARIWDAYWGEIPHESWYAICLDALLFARYNRTSFLNDVSYYYQLCPPFIDQLEYTWPPNGANTNLNFDGEVEELCDRIPAEERWSSPPMTYNPNPTLHTYTLSGTITQNLTLQGYVNIIGDVTIASGYTLTLKPGTIVRANANTRITVNGTLKAEGTASQKITFTRSGTTGAWYGIRFEDSSVDANCIVKYSDIQYASYGIFCNSASPKIENNTFSNNTYAIYLYYSSPSIKSNLATNDIVHCDNSSPYMENNRITSSAQTYPLYIYGANAAPQLFHNTITGDMLYGVYAYNSCAPRFGSNTDTTSGHNRIEHNGGDFSIFAQNYAQPFLGSTYVCAYRRGGNNAVVGNDFTCKVYASNNSRVDAEYTWWGQYPPPSGWFYATGNSVINYANARSTDPGGGSSLSKAFADPNPGMPIITESESPDPAECDSLWKTAENLRLADASTKAAANTMYQTLIAQFPYAVKAHHSLIRIVHLMNSTDLNGLIAYLSSLIDTKTHPDELKAVAKDVLTCCYNQADDYKNAIQTAEQILQQYPKSEHEYTALFNLFNIYQKDLADESTAKTYLEILKADYPDHELTLIARFDMGEPVEWKLAKRFVPQPPASAQIVALPQEYRLGMNFPNPFNPSTVIPYELPEASHVKLTIYDILGREVITLVDAPIPAGYQQSLWDGKDRSGNQVANGVYIYNIQANGFSQSRKLLLLK